MRKNRIRPETDKMENSPPKYSFTELTDEERERLAKLGIDPDASLKAFLLQIRTGKKLK